MKDILPKEQTRFIESGLAADEELDAVFQLPPRATAGGGKQEPENKTALFNPAPIGIGVSVLALFLLVHSHVWPAIVTQRKTKLREETLDQNEGQIQQLWAIGIRAARLFP